MELFIGNFREKYRHFLEKMKDFREMFHYFSQKKRQLIKEKNKKCFFFLYLHCILDYNDSCLVCLLCYALVFNITKI